MLLVTCSNFKFTLHSFGVFHEPGFHKFIQVKGSDKGTQFLPHVGVLKSEKEVCLDEPGFVSGVEAGSFILEAENRHGVEKPADCVGKLYFPSGARFGILDPCGEPPMDEQLSVREAARLMGAPDKFKLPGTYNDGYKAMGDGVAVPVASHLAKHLLRPLVRAAS